LQFVQLVQHAPGCPHIIHRAKPVISPALSEVEGNGGTVLSCPEPRRVAAPERRYGSASHVFCAMKPLFDFGFRASCLAAADCNSK
jgi:hypothetical protein